MLSDAVRLGTLMKLRSCDTTCTQDRGVYRELLAGRPCMSVSVNT